MYILIYIYIYMNILYSTRFRIRGITTYGCLPVAIGWLFKPRKFFLTKWEKHHEGKITSRIKRKRSLNGPYMVSTSPPPFHPFPSLPRSPIYILFLNSSYSSFSLPTSSILILFYPPLANLTLPFTLSVQSAILLSGSRGEGGRGVSGFFAAARKTNQFLVWFYGASL